MCPPSNLYTQLTPRTQEVLQAIAKSGRPPIATLTAQQAKEAYALGAGILEAPIPVMARDETLKISVRDGSQLRAKLWSPNPTNGSAALPVLLYHFAHLLVLVLKKLLFYLIPVLLSHL